MPPERQALLRIAEAVVDRTPVDWEKERDALGELEGELGCLRLIERVGAVHRELHIEPSGTTDQTTVASLNEEPPLTQWGPLKIVERIGSGGFGEVYRAHDPTLDRDVALKLWHADLLRHRTGEKQFLNEARRLARVRHPKVLTVHGADRHADRVGLWADLLEGKTLEECLKERGPFGANEAALIGIDLCGALAAVHAAGLVHRDVKTANVMRETGGRIVLLDFSSVTNRRPSTEDSNGARFSGTPSFMAPELFRGEDSGTRSDIYSLGVVLYRLVSGRLPVEAENVLELREKHERGESTPLRDVRPDLPPAFVRAVERAIASDPEERYATIGEMERALSASHVTPVPVPPPWLRWQAIATVAASVVFVALLTWVFWPPPFQVEAALYRAGAGVEERLLEGGRVLPGDSLFLEIEGTRPMHVYVLDEDEHGNAFVLFPLPGLDQQNPLSAKLLHRLPGTVDGKNNYWDVTSAGGTETILVVASRGPLKDVERKLEALPLAGSTVPRELPDSDLLPELRGIGGLSPRQPTPEEGSELSGIAGRLSVRAGSESGIWLWEMQLANP